MVADNKVQFICSDNLNAPTVTDSWGVLIAALDVALVSGLALPSVASAQIDNNRMTLNFGVPHKVKLFQIIELASFSPSEANGKWRVIAVPNASTLIIDTVATSVTAIGTAKLPSLGYTKEFNASNKAVYRCTDTTKEYRPFLRFDCGAPSNYPTTTVKFARVGLMTECTSIDDISSGTKLPYNSSSPNANWESTGAGNDATLYWAKWVYSETKLTTADANQTFNTSSAGNKIWTIVGDDQAFYLIIASSNDNQTPKQVYGIGIYDKLRPTEYPYFIGAVAFQGKLSDYTYLNNASQDAGQGMMPWRGFSYNDASERYGRYNNGIPTSRVLVTNKNGDTEYTNTNFGKDTPWGYADGPTIIPQYVVSGFRGKFKHIMHSVTNLNSATHFYTANYDGAMYLVEPSCFKQVYDLTNFTYGMPFYLGEL